MSALNRHFTVNTYSFSLNFTAAEAIEMVAAAGFTSVELMMYPGHLWFAADERRTVDQAVAAMAREGVGVTTLNQPNLDINISAATREMRDYSLHVVSNMVRLAGEIGCPGVIIAPGKLNSLLPVPVSEITARLHAALDVLVPLAAEVGTRILVENQPPAFANTVAAISELLDGYGPSSVGVVYDVANGDFLGEDHHTALRTVSERLDQVHLSDTGRDVCTHDPIGTGDVDYVAVLEALRSIDWDVKPVLEVIGSPYEPMAGVIESVAALEAAGWNASNIGRLDSRHERTRS